MNIDSFTIIKELGKGMSGTVYLAKYKKKKYALKIEKIAEKNIIDTKFLSREQRELEFSYNFANKYPNQFVVLLKHDIVVCSHEQNYPRDPSYLPKDVQQLFEEKEKSKMCIRKVYPLIDGILKDIEDNLTQEQFYSYIIQLTFIIYLMTSNGYVHNDLHSSNIGYIKVNNRSTVNILGKKIPTFGYIFKAFDFGLVTHLKYNLSKTDLLKHNINFEDEINRIITKRLVYFEDNPYNLKIQRFVAIDPKTKLKFKKLSFYNTFNFEDISEDDKFLLFQIYFPKESQKILIGKSLKKVYKPILRVELADILCIIVNKTKLINIINYFSCKILNNL